jgi:hypothetical protein
MERGVVTCFRGWAPGRYGAVQVNGIGTRAQEEPALGFGSTTGCLELATELTE